MERSVIEPNRTPIVRMTSIWFGNRTLRKVPVRLCSITEKIEQQSDRLSSIDFWFGFVRLATPGEKYGQVDVCAVEPEDSLKIDRPKIDKRLSK